MRTNKAILAGALIAPMLALGGGLAYASTSSGSPPPATRTAVTSTVQTHYQHTTSQPHRNRCYWQGRGNHPCGWRGHGYQRQPAGQPSHRHAAHRHAGYRHYYGYHGRNHYGYGGQRGDWGYWGSGYYGSGYRWSHCSGCRGSGW